MILFNSFMLCSLVLRLALMSVSVPINSLLQLGEDNLTSLSSTHQLHVQYIIRFGFLGRIYLILVVTFFYKDYCSFTCSYRFG